MVSFCEAAIYLIKDNYHSAIHITVFVKFYKVKRILKSLGSSTCNGLKLIPGPWTASNASVCGKS